MHVESHSYSGVQREVELPLIVDSAFSLLLTARFVFLFRRM